MSALSIADGALGQLSAIVIRQKELAQQAANGVYSTAQRRAMHTEANALVDEYNRIVGSTAFNGVKLLDGSYLNASLQAGYGVNGGLRMGIGDDLQRAVGDGTFTVGATISSASFNTYVNTADFDGDGNLDLVLPGSGVIMVHRGNGDGTFLAPTSYAHNLPNNAVQFVIGDFNGDGRPDIFTPSYAVNAANSVLINRGDGTFNTAITNIAIPASFTIVNLSIVGSGDFNGDGFDDVALGNNAAGGGVAIYLSNGDGTFLAPVTRSTGANVNTGVIADMNDDGIDDIITNDFGSGSFTVVYGQTSGVAAGTTISTQVLYGVNSPNTLAAGDINRDGIQDLVVTHSTNQSFVLLGNGNGNGTFALGHSFTLGGANSTSTLADLNGDGYLDLLQTGSGAGNNYTMLGNGDGSFRAAFTANATLINSGGRNVVAADFNNDGAADLLTSNNAGLYTNISLSNTTDSSYVGYLNLMSKADARAAMDILDDALQRINLERGRVGESAVPFCCGDRSIADIQNKLHRGF